MIGEIREIPEKARLCYKNNRNIGLPLHVPYIGMGSSYYAPLVLKYLGCNIIPEIASEYYYSTSKNKDYHLAVLISQSGYSSETIWNIEKFAEYIAVVNDTASPLARSEKLKHLVEIYAGTEKYSSTKTYVNTLITLYQGMGIDSDSAISVIEKNMHGYEDWGEKQADIIFAEYRKGVKGIFILGNGSNIATAYEAALILTETTKIPFIPMALAQYDHGPKESAENTIVIAVNTDGPVKERTNRLLKTITNAGAVTLLWEESHVEEYLSPITSIVPFNFLANALATRLGVKDTFSVGNKVTVVNPPDKKPDRD